MIRKNQNQTFDLKNLFFLFSFFFLLLSYSLFFPPIFCFFFFIFSIKLSPPLLSLFLRCFQSQSQLSDLSCNPREGPCSKNPLFTSNCTNGQLKETAIVSKTLTVVSLATGEKIYIL